MKKIVVYCAGHTGALEYAASYLTDAGIRFCQKPDPSVTHLLLPVPSLDPDGRIKGGPLLTELLPLLPPSVTVLGGGLEHPALAGYTVRDLLQDPEYLAENAAITAYCALTVAAEKLPITLKGCPTLVIGWGRIGKCLADLLHRLGANVTVAARKQADRAMIRALGLKAMELDGILPEAFRLIFNTAPEPVLPPCQGNILKIDLASRRGIEGEDVLWARGLPGKLAPESSGRLIARTVMEKEFSL